jgi:hypothetical protein
MIYPRSRIFTIHHNAIIASHTGNTSATALRTVTIPAGAMGANGGVRITGLFSYPNNGNNKTLSVLFNGTVIYNIVATTTVHNRFQISVHNRNSVSSQVAAPNGLNGGWGQTTGALVTASHNTDTTAIPIVFRTTLGSAADTVNLEYSHIELFTSGG